jgi:hypothetical protein
MGCRRGKYGEVTKPNRLLPVVGDSEEELANSDIEPVKSITEVRCLFGDSRRKEGRDNRMQAEGTLDIGTNFVQAEGRRETVGGIGKRKER